MAKPTARVLHLLEVLQSGGLHRVRDLAAGLGVDERTVRRYVEHLLELDVPVETVRGRYGGYRLAPGFRLPPLMLSDEEAIAVLLGLALLRRSGLSSDDASASAEGKLRRVLPQAKARRLAALQESLHISSVPREPSAADTGTLLLLAEAARDNRLVAFAYRSVGGRESARVLAPYGIVAHRGRWLVSGMDQGRAEIRTFRIDRMILPRRLEQTFQEPVDVDVLGQVMTGIATARRSYRVVARARTSVSDARARLPATVAVVSQAESGWVTITIHAESLDWVPSLLVQLGCPFVVVEPEELRARVEALGHLLIEAADNSVTAADDVVT